MIAPIPTPFISLLTVSNKFLVSSDTAALQAGMNASPVMAARTTPNLVNCSRICRKE